MTSPNRSTADPGLFLHMGNRLEKLVDELSRILETPLGSPFDTETIVVQSRGMQRWLCMQIARRRGIFANGAFPFPNAFVHQLCRCIDPALEDPEQSPFHPSTMMFRLLSLLPDCIQRPGFEPLRAYLQDDADKRMRLALAEKIADLFDQYQVFRPDLILQWEAGRQQHWQARLWRRLAAAGGEGAHRARLRQRLVEAMADGQGTLAELPERVSVFGISYLPPFHLEVLTALSRRVPVHVFIVNPCREYWADIAGRREAVRIVRRYAAQAAEPGPDLHLEEGNRLLAATGTLGRDFLGLAVDCGAQITEHFEAPGSDRLLNRIQSDILHLRDPVGASGGVLDASVQIHACHSPMREVEVLHDQLLDLFETDPGLLPRDVLVMAPDIERYGPLIHAVFDAPGEDRVRIPYSVADSSVRRNSRMAAGLLTILDLVDGRLGASEVLGLLEIGPIRRRFDMSEEDLGLVSRWVSDSGVRWGRDAGQRRRLGLPETAENSWQAGIDRMLLGYAVAGEDALFDGIVPYGHIEGGDAQLLGRFLEFVRRLFGVLDRLSGEHPPVRWKTLLSDAIESLFLHREETESERQELASCLEDLAHHAETAGCRVPLCAEAVGAWLGRRLESRSFGSGFISGGVTFCAMVPMRSIPFEVICMVGMNAGDFPRESRPLGFDLMAARPRPGDRNRRDDDKYLFLEALLSARQRLYISYVGQGVCDNAAMPPSVLVSELIDALQRGYGIDPGELVVRHRLQAFSPRYFSPEGRLFSYSPENLGGAEALAGNKRLRPFLDDALPMEAAERDRWQVLDLSALCAFFSHPVRFLLQQRLGVFLEAEAEGPEDREAFSIDGLLAYRIGQELVQDALGGAPPMRRLPQERGRGRLPHGSPGEVGFRRLGLEARRFAEKIRRLDMGNGLPPAGVRLEIGGVSLRGALADLYPGGIRRFRYGRMRPVDLLDGWIRHLVLCAVRPPSAETATALYFRDKAWRFSPVQEAQALIEELLGLYQSGLRRPLRFFPVTSEAYARARFAGAAPPTAMARARRRWADDFRPGESDDPYIRLGFRDQEPLDEAFCTLAESVWTPLLSCGGPLSW